MANLGLARGRLAAPRAAGSEAILKAGRSQDLIQQAGFFLAIFARDSAKLSLPALDRGRGDIRRLSESRDDLAVSNVASLARDR